MRPRLTGLLVCAALVSLLIAGSAQATGGTLDLENFDIQLENSTYITLAGISCNPSGTSTVNFTMAGPVQGPHPGTLSGSGSFTIGPQTLAGYFNNDFRNVGPILSFNETFTITSAGTTINGTGSLITPPPGASISGATLNTAECAHVTGATLSQVTNANGVVVNAYLTAGINAPLAYAPPGAYAYTVITRQFIDSSSIGAFNAGEFAQNFRTPPVPPAPAGIVTRSGNQLQLNGQPFRPIGLNIYNANSNGWCWYKMDGTLLDDALTSLGPDNTIRAWFFQPLATTNGTRDWTAFDRTLAKAQAHGYKVIATLTDQWGDCGQTDANPGYGYKNVNWYESAYKQPDPAGTVPYRDWVQEVAARYVNDPTILAWQLVNEPEVMPYKGADCSTVPESTATATLKAFAQDVAGAIKAVDPYHLVSLGTIGGGQCGTQAGDYKDVMSLQDLDLCEYHDYTPGQPIPGDQWNGLQVRINQCNELNKPLLVGELGVKPSDVGGTLQARADVVTDKVCAQFNAGAAGILLWAWDKNGSLLNNYDIGPGDPVLDALRTPPSACDSNHDGVVDTLQPAGTPAGAFVDNSVAPPTNGSITNANGLSVKITDAPGSDGVTVTVGPGTGSVELSVCGGFIVQVAPDSSAVITCGSVRVAVASGTARILLGGGVTVVSLDAGDVAKVSANTSGGFLVDNLGTTPVDVTVDGTQATIPAGAPEKPLQAWHFIGFAQPVDGNNVLNLAKAGRAIPLKWQVLDAQNNPVTTLTKAAVSVVSLSCTAATTDTLEEYAAGNSGLQNLGAGYYQFNWQTPTSYAGSCRTMKLDIGDGVIHQALFKFTK
jgi:mannan endo-1,4-beta-mannosidase